MSDDNNEDHETPSSTPNLKTELARALQKLAPEAIADGKVDVVKLKELLGDDVGNDSERFGLFWPGKRAALRAAQEPTTATLRPQRENSKDWDSTENVFIEGDNLEALKILQKHYHGKIEMIYIDPPYNTGKDFLYPDNYKEGLAAYLDWTKQVNEEGKALSTNSESDGRYHSNWLNMMYPRLKLARNLLTDDGLIFVSIDDNEIDNLKKVCNEIFGEENFVALAPRKTGAGSAATRSEAALRKLNDFVLIYTRSDQAILQRKLVGQKEYPFEDEGGSYRLGQFQASGSDATRRSRPKMWYPIYVTHSGELTTIKPEAYSEELFPNEVNGEDGRWLWSTEKFEADKSRLINFDGKTISRKIYFDESQDQNVYQVEKAWFDEFTNASGTKEIEELFGRKKMFDHPKPTSLIKHLLKLHPNTDALVLDFFAGSGTTAHGVIKLNADDGGGRRWILVQLPEPTPDGSAPRAAGFDTISELSRRRIELAGEQIRGGTGQLELDNEVDVGFRSYSLVDTNFSKWQVANDVEVDSLQQHLLQLKDSVDDDATPDALLTEVLLKQGYSLSERAESVEISGLNVQSVGGGLMLAYLDEHIKPSLSQLVALVEADPGKLVILEDAFWGDDELKTNLAQLCKSKSIELWTA